MAVYGHGHENISIDWDSIQWDELNLEEKWNYEHLIGCIKSMRRACRDDLGPPASFVCWSDSSSTVEEKENTQICFVLSFGI